MSHRPPETRIYIYRLRELQKEISPPNSARLLFKGNAKMVTQLINWPRKMFSINNPTLEGNTILANPPSSKKGKLIQMC